MPRLIDRQRQIPNGLRFELPEVGYKSGWYSSFDTIVNAVQNVINGNQDLARRYGWPTSRSDIADWVDDFNARLCIQNGWTQFVTNPNDTSPPGSFSLPPQEKSRLDAAAGLVRKIWAGVKTLDSWIDSGEPAVPFELAEARASVCAACPKNGAGDFTKWFSAPAAAIIKRQQSKLAQRNLATTMDSKLGVCEVCLCPLKLKVHTPISFIEGSMSSEVLAELNEVPGCWIPKELVK